MNLAPLAIQKFFDNDGRPLVAGLLFTYTAGTTTKVATYTDSSGAFPNSNPVVLNFRGECRVWLDPTLSYKFVLAPSTDTDPPSQPIWTVDNITGTPAIMDNAALDTGSANVVQLSIPTLPSTPVIFTRILWKSTQTNTGAMTLVINGGPAKALTWQNLQSLSAGGVHNNGMYEAIYDGTRWQLVSPSLSPPDYQTAAEISAGVTPANYVYPEGHVYRYGVNTSPGSTDMTTAINAAATVARASGCTVVLPGEVCLFSAPLIFTGCNVRGQQAITVCLRATSSQFNCIVSEGNSTFEDFYIDGGWDGVTAGLSGNLFHFVNSSGGLIVYNIHMRNIGAINAKRSLIFWTGAGYSSIYAFRGVTAGLHGLEIDDSVFESTTVRVGGYSQLSTTPNGYSIKITNGNMISFNGVICEQSSGIQILGINNRSLDFNDVYQENSTNPSTNYLDASTGAGIGLSVTNSFGGTKVIQSVENWINVHFDGNSALTEPAVPYAGKVITADSGELTTTTTGGVNVTVTSVVLPPGSWSVTGTFQCITATATNLTQAAVNFTTNVADNGLANATNANFKFGAATAQYNPGAQLDQRLNMFTPYRNTTGGNVTLYMRGFMNFSGAGTLAYRGAIYAEKLR